jgi:hypothetical protein
MKSLVIGQNNTITFQVNVMGTSIEPRVRVFLSTTPELSYDASKSVDTWSASIVLPEGTPEGTFNLRVEVLLNNRLFTPMTLPVVLIQHDAMTIKEAADKPDIKILVGDAVKPETVSDNKPYLAAIAKIFKTENAEVNSVKIAYAPIIPREMTDAAIDASLPITEKTKVAVVKKIVEIKHEFPVSLIKGTVVYE